MPSTDYSGQEFIIGAFNSVLDDSEQAQEFSPIVFSNSIDDSELGQQIQAVQVNSDFMCGEGGAVTLVYKMYGYCTIHNVFESWIAIGVPDPNPPVGHTILSGSTSYIVL